MLKRVQHDKKKCVIPNLFRNLEFGNENKSIAFALNSRNQISIQGAVLDGFGEMSGLDIFLPFKIGNGSSHLQNPRISPGAQSKFVNRHFQQLLACLIDLAVFLNMPVRHLGIAVDLDPFESIELDLPGLIDSSFDLTGRLS